MCSVKANVCIPRETAVCIISSNVSFAWPGQNWPEWLCIEKAMTGRGEELRKGKELGGTGRSLDKV
jgi:hypothetical protein